MNMEFEEEKLTEALVLARTRAVDLDNVKKLNFWGSEITDISVVRNMPNLEVCSVSVNSITTLEDFSHCKYLQELYIRKNKIASLKEICHLKKLKKLRNLWLADNPCASEENYRYTVLRNLPKLQKLDNVVVKESELAESKEKGEVYSGGEEDDEDIEDTEATNTTETEEETETNNHTEETEDTGKHHTEDTGKHHTEDTGKHHTEDTGKHHTEDTGKHHHREETGKPHHTEETKPTARSMLDPVTLTWEETNKIRGELGLKPLPYEKMTSPKQPTNINVNSSRNAHVLQAVLILIRELDDDSLEMVGNAIKRKLQKNSTS